MIAIRLFMLSYLYVRLTLMKASAKRGICRWIVKEKFTKGKSNLRIEKRIRYILRGEEPIETKRLAVGSNAADSRGGEINESKGCKDNPDDGRRV